MLTSEAKQANKKRLTPKSGVSYDLQYKPRSKASKKTGVSHDPLCGLDVSIKTTFICIVNEKGKIVKELEAPSIPEEIDSFLLGTGLQIEKIGIESGCLTHYLKKGLKKKGYEVIGMESHKMAAILATIINKTTKTTLEALQRL